MQKQCTKRLPALFFTILMGILFFLTPFCQGEEKAKALPFSPGEELHYTVGWEKVRAGRAKISILPITTANGEKAYHFMLEAESNRTIDLFYKVRDRLEGFADTGLTRSLLYKKVQSGKEKREVAVLFDWKKNTATYSNAGTKRDPVKIPLNTFDPVSSFYKMRLLDFKPGETLSFPVTDGKKVFNQDATVIKKEKLTLSSGTFDTFLLELAVTHFSGVFKKSENPTVKLWVTADDQKIPVRIKVKVFLGSIVVDLVSVK